MKNPLPMLDEIRVASPCHANWADMEGTAQARFCEECDKFVYNLSGMTTSAAEQLIQRHEGRLCVRYYRRADGTILTQDCPVGRFAAIRRNVVIAMSTLAVMVSGLVGWALGRASNSYTGPTSILNWHEPDDELIMGDMCPVPPPEENH